MSCPAYSEHCLAEKFTRNLRDVPTLVARDFQLVAPFAIEAGSNADAKLIAVQRGLTVDKVESVAGVDKSGFERSDRPS